MLQAMGFVTLVYLGCPVHVFFSTREIKINIGLCPSYTKQPLAIIWTGWELNETVR